MFTIFNLDMFDFSSAMVFAAHPDDEIIGCGGTIAKYVDRGKAVDVVCVSSSGNEEERAVRGGEARRAAEFLGVRNLYFLGEPERFIDYNEKALKGAISILRSSRPDIVFAPHSGEGDRDHRAVYDIVNEAVWIASSPHMQDLGEKCDVRALLLYEVWTPMDEPHVAEDVTGFMDRKIEALGKHESQLSVIRYDEAAKGLNRYRGAMTGAGDYAEVFKIKFLKGSLV
ncbi:MAG: PIG-L family deacetylase [Candidatus Aenigmarchaeota archaeon]|nr:PIG-L family deacetylase [Candidatus Aenigmarchaeota archaeon]